MAGIYVPGLEKPENCICCDLSYEDGWCPAKHDYVDAHSYDTCPVIHVQDHGRLVDADKCAELDMNPWDAPTVIPADRR